jgi:hypothetical protein
MGKLPSRRADWNFLIFRHVNLIHFSLPLLFPSFPAPYPTRWAPWASDVRWSYVRWPVQLCSRVKTHPSVSLSSSPAERRGNSSVAFTVACFRTLFVARMWQQVVVAWFSYYPEICLEGLRKKPVNLSHESWCPGRNSIQALPECKPTPNRCYIWEKLTYELTPWVLQINTIKCFKPSFVQRLLLLLFT